MRTFAQRAELRDYKFTSIFDDALLDGEDRIPLRSGVVMKSRATALNAPLSAPSSKPSGGQLVLAVCWDALTAAIADLDITPYEIFYLKAKQNALGVRPEELRWMHARAFSGVLADMCQDKAITDEEAALSGVADALRELGWVPGDEPSASVVL